MFHSGEGSFWINPGYLQEKPPMIPCVRLQEYNLKHAMRGLRYAILRNERDRISLFVSEIGLTANGLVAWRELILLAGELVGMAHIPFVTQMLARFTEWNKLCVESTPDNVNQFNADYTLKTCSNDLRRPILEVALQMGALTKDTSSDSLARYTAYIGSGVLSIVDSTAKPPIINNNPMWARNFPGKPRNVGKAATALIVGLVSRDPLRATANALLLCAWAYPDLAWTIIYEYTTMTGLTPYSPIIEDLRYMWATFCLVSNDRSNVPRAEYWGRYRVFMTMAILLICRMPSSLPNMPDAVQLQDENVSKLFNSSTPIRHGTPSLEMLPPPGRYSEEQMASAPKGELPAEVAMRYAMQPENAMPDEFREPLTKAIALAYTRNNTSFGVRSCFERFAEAYAHGCNNCDMETYRKAGPVTSVQDSLVLRQDGVVDIIPGVLGDSARALGREEEYGGGENTKPAKRYIPDILMDRHAEWVAIFRPPSPVEGLQDDMGYAIVKGPYVKQGLYRSMFAAQTLRSFLNFPKTWEFKIITARKKQVMVIRPPWPMTVALPAPQTWLEILRNTEVPTKNKAQILIERYFMERPMTGKMFFTAGEKILARDENVVPFVSWDESPGVGASLKEELDWVQNSMDVIMEIARGLPEATVPLNVKETHKKAESRIAQMRIANKDKLRMRLQQFTAKFK